MKKLCLLLLLLSGVAFSQEIRRPTADSDNSGATCTGGVVATSAMANSYDASGLSTSSAYTITGVPTSLAKRGGRSFTTWAAASGSYTALTLNVNASGADNGQGLMTSSLLQYSTDSGSNWTTITDGGSAGFSQQTFTITLSSFQVLANVQVRSCIGVAGSSGGATGAGTITIWDIWTSGTIVVNNTQSVTETVTVSPAVVAVYNAIKTEAESITVSPAVADGLNMHEALSEGVTTSTTLYLGIGRKMSDSIAVSSAVAMVLGKNISESSGIVDSDSRLVTIHDSLGETVVATPTVLGIANHVVTANQPVSLSDLDARVVNMHYNLLNTITVSPNTILGNGRFVSDALLVSPVAAIVKGAVRVMTDGFTLKALLSTLAVTPHSVSYTNHEVGIIADTVLVSVHSSKKKSTTVIMSL